MIIGTVSFGAVDGGGDRGEGFGGVSTLEVWIVEAMAGRDPHQRLGNFTLEAAVLHLLHAIHQRLALHLGLEKVAHHQSEHYARFRHDVGAQLPRI